MHIILEYTVLDEGLAVTHDVGALKGSQNADFVEGVLLLTMTE
jgi:hypothetical protein